MPAESLEAAAVYKRILVASNVDFAHEVGSTLVGMSNAASTAIGGGLDGYDIPTRVGDGESSVKTPAVGVRAEVA